MNEIRHWANTFSCKTNLIIASHVIIYPRNGQYLNYYKK